MRTFSSSPRLLARRGRRERLLDRESNTGLVPWLSSARNAQPMSVGLATSTKRRTRKVAGCEDA
jgi:hypothetical protein